MGYLFDPELLHEACRTHLGLPQEKMFRGIAADLSRAYPGHIETRENWVFNLAGGCKGIMTILHASLSEYLLFYGTPIGSGGYSGRYLMDVYDFMLSGELASYTQSAFGAAAHYRAGDLAFLKKWQVKCFTLTPGSWMLEYGRGVIPASLPFALGDALFSCVDLITISKTLWLYTRLVVKELWKGKI
jgi:C-8 sterol isomerase